MDARKLAGRVLAPVRPLVQRRRGMVPGYLVVGTKRGGSTSLADWINQHPEVAPCRTRKGTHYFDVNYSRGWSWYLSAFEGRSSQWETTGEASPYYMFHPLAAERIARHLPDARLVVSLRDPIERAWSHHRYETEKGYETEDFDRAIDLEAQRTGGEEERLRSDGSYQSFAHRHHTYLARGHYAEQLERIYGLFPREQVLVLRTEDVFTDPHTQLDRVWDHIGVSRVRLDGLSRRKETSKDLTMSPATRRRLQSYYGEWNDRLYQLNGIDFRSQAAPGAEAG